MDELKHSIALHIMIHGGPSAQLAAFLVKLVDLVDDANAERKSTEATLLASVIAEAVAIHVERFVLAQLEQVGNLTDADLVSRIRQRADGILMTIGVGKRHKENQDKIAVKNAMLSAAAAALRELSLLTKKEYPAFTDCQGNQL